MKIQKRLILWHRYLGIATCLLFAMWFLSGFFMMYVRMPRIPEEERLARLPVLEAARVVVAPADAIRLAKLTGEPQASVLTSLWGRPVYRFTLTAGKYVTVFADTGEVRRGFSWDEARRSVAEPRSSFLGAETEPDQWTVAQTYRAHQPLYRVAIDDGRGTELYVSSQTGDLLLKTDRASRILGWLSAVPHYLYFTVLRKHPSLWNDVVVWTSLVGCLMVIVGAAVGLWRFSPSKRYRFREDGPRSSPYTGLKRLHHYGGLIFGAVTLTWIFSGMMSMNPWKYSPSTAPQSAERTALRGSNWTLRSLAEPVRIAPNAKEVEFLQAFGQPLLRSVVSANQSSIDTSAKFDAPRIVAAIGAIVPGGEIEDWSLLPDYDSYYYDRKNLRPLPAIRARFDDPRAVWLYIDATTAQPLMRYERTSRIHRWLYHGLHSFDFPFLYRRRPLWDIAVFVLGLGGFALSLTGVWIGWKRLRKTPERAKAPPPALVSSR